MFKVFNRIDQNGNPYLEYYMPYDENFDFKIDPVSCEMDENGNCRINLDPNNSGVIRVTSIRVHKQQLTPLLKCQNI
jgi:hypothetical protein